MWYLKQEESLIKKNNSLNARLNSSRECSDIFLLFSYFFFFFFFEKIYIAHMKFHALFTWKKKKGKNILECYYLL